MEKKWNLNDGWKLTYFPNCEVKAKGIDFQQVSDFQNVSFIPASVPGNFELDFQAAGLIDEPFYGDNIAKLQKYENLHLWYYREFDLPEECDGKLYLDFEGIDTVADIYINGEKKHVENMLIAHSFEVTGILKAKKNSLVVHILPSAIVAREEDFTAGMQAMTYEGGSIVLRKAASAFGWDIMARAVSGGLWKPVYLVCKQETHFEEVYAYTKRIDAGRKIGYINFFYRFMTEDDFIANRYSVKIHGRCTDSEFSAEQKVWHNAGTFEFRIPDCQFWWPKNYGEPNLYDVTAELLCEGKTVDTEEFRLGVRTVQLHRTSVECGEDSDFRFIINDTPIFCLGTNWVPLDAYHSRDIRNLPRALSLLKEIGCNMVRCWGGNVYENDEFYDFCDENGILIWQDFGMGCGIYPQTDAFCQKLAEEAVAVIKRLRNHVCITLWAGDNECDCAYGSQRDPNNNILTRKILADAVREHDVHRPYLPSSPYIDEEAFRTKLPTTEDHLWGPRDYFKGNYYGTTVCHFASEGGYHGCPSPLSLKKFIRPEQIWPMFDEKGYPKEDWVLHGTQPDGDRNGIFGYRTELMANQVKVLFGKMPEDLDTFCRMSQISEAEADKYFIERFRLSKWRRTGFIWWNLIDGWPQISDAVVDYYGIKKIAFSYIKRSQNPLCLMFDEPKDGKITLYAVNDTLVEKAVDFTVTRHSDGKTVLSGKVTVPANTSVAVGEYSLTTDGQEYLAITWNGGNFNHYVTHIKDIDYREYSAFINAHGMNEWCGFAEE